MTDYTYFTSGRIYARPYGSAQQFQYFGLVDVITVNTTENVIQLPDRTQPGGGVYKEIRRIESAQLALAHREFYPEVLARAFLGAFAEVEGGVGNPVSNEMHTAFLGQFIPLAHPGPYTNLTATDGHPSDPQAIAAAGNFEVRPGGIFILPDAEDLVDEDPIAFSYQHPNYHRVQALTTTPPELEVFFAGQNEARGDKEVRMRFHKVKFGPIQELQVLSADDFGVINVTGELLKDLTKTGDGISQFFLYEEETEAA